MKKIKAIILAAGMASRFKPYSLIKPKALFKVKGEILIERQIIQLKEANIDDITIICGYKAELFKYLTNKYSVKIIYNDLYETHNNIASLNLLDSLENTLICSADNYYLTNLFKTDYTKSFYFVKESLVCTDEWIVKWDKEKIIKDIIIKGSGFYLIGACFLKDKEAEILLKLVKENYDNPKYKSGVWEYLYLDNLNKIKIEVRDSKNQILEFDSLADVLAFDPDFLTANGFVNKL